MSFSYRMPHIYIYCLGLGLTNISKLFYLRDRNGFNSEGQWIAGILGTRRTCGEQYSHTWNPT